VTSAAETLLVELEKAVPLYSQPDPEVPEKPPPFPYTQIIYAIIGTLLLLTMVGICCYFWRKKGNDTEKSKESSWNSETSGTSVVPQNEKGGQVVTV